MELEVRLIDSMPDSRGGSWAVPEHLLPSNFVLRDVHVTTVLPGATRGDHFHRHKREVLLITYRDSWSLHWDSGSRQFEGQGCAAVVVPPLLSHAIYNSGQVPMHVVAFADTPYDAAQPDSHHRRVSSS